MTLNKEWNLPDTLQEREAIFGVIEKEPRPGSALVGHDWHDIRHRYRTVPNIHGDFEPLTPRSLSVFLAIAKNTCGLNPDEILNKGEVHRCDQLRWDDAAEEADVEEDGPRWLVYFPDDRMFYVPFIYSYLHHEGRQPRKYAADDAPDAVRQLTWYPNFWSGWEPVMSRLVSKEDLRKVEIQYEGQPRTWRETFWMAKEWIGGVFGLGIFLVVVVGLWNFGASFFGADVSVGGAVTGFEWVWSLVIVGAFFILMHNHIDAIALRTRKLKRLLNVTRQELRNLRAQVASQQREFD